MSAEEIKLAVCYCRVSSRRQEEKGLSLDAQEDYLRNWVVDKPYDIVKVFQVVESASKPERKHLFEAFQYCITNNIEHILITDSDRWTRSRELDTEAQKVIKKHDLKVHIVRERKVIGQFGTAAEKLMHNIKVDVDEYASDILREKVEEGIRMKLERSEFPGSAPLGYRNVPKTKATPVAQIVPDEVMFPRVKKFLLTHYKGTYSTDDMMRVAKNLGLKSKMGNDLSNGSVRWLLHNRFYCGEFSYTFQGEERIYKNKTQGFVPMITKKQWEKNQAILKSKMVNTTTKRDTPWKYKEFVHCSSCERYMVGEVARVNYTKKDGTKVKYESEPYYHCSGGHYFVDSKGHKVDKAWIQKDEFGNYFFEHVDGRKEEAERKTCTVESIKESELEEHLLWELGTIKFKKSVWNRMKTAIFKNPQKEQVRVELQALRTEYTKNETKLGTMYDDKIEKKITERFWMSQKEKIEARQVEIEGRIAELEELKKFYEVKIKKAVTALDALENFGEKFKKADTKTRKQLAAIMVRKIFVIGGGKDSHGYKIPYDLYIEWNDEFSELYELGLVELTAELDKKYRSGLNISNEKNRIATLRSQ